MRVPWIPPNDVAAWLREHYACDLETGIIFFRKTMQPVKVTLEKEGYYRFGATNVKLGLVSQKIFVHRFVWFFGTGQFASTPIDHVDRNRTNNAFSNLRVSGYTGNGRNRAKFAGLAHPSSRYKGVTWNRQTSKWIAQIRIDGKLKHLGRFVDEHDAACAYNQAARLAFGEFAVLNEVVT